MGTAQEQEIELWDGALALAEALDHMVENKIDAKILAGNLEDCGADSEAVIAAMVASGLFLEVFSTTDGPRVDGIKPSKRELTLTRTGRLVIIHATSCL